LSTLLVKIFSSFLNLFTVDKLRYPAKILYVLLSYYRSDVIDQNLKSTFPNKLPTDLNHLSKAYRKQLSQTIVEVFKGFFLSQTVLADRFVFKNSEIANKYYEEGKSIILTLGHIGNWEWGQAVVTHFLRHKCIGVYKPLSDKSFERYILKKRSQYGVKLLPQKKLLKYLISHPQETNVYIFIADQYPPVEPRTELDFLGRRTLFDKSIDKIAKKYSMPVLYADITKVSHARYETELIEISNGSSLNDITGAYAALLESNILKDPELWLWSHRRWK